MTTSYTPATLREIDLALAAVEQRAQPILDALNKASALAAPQPSPTTSEADSERRRSVAAWLLGRAERADVDRAHAVAEREAAKLAKHRQAAAHEAELARLGTEELRAMLEPINAEAAQLRGHRASVVAGILDADVHAAAMAYRAAMIDAASAYARLRAIGERATEAGGYRHQFPTFSRIIGPAPSAGSEAVFGTAALGGFEVFIVSGQGEPPRGLMEAVVRMEDAHREVAAELAGRGLT